jgi:hypothetical protein
MIKQRDKILQPSAKKILLNWHLLLLLEILLFSSNAHTNNDSAMDSNQPPKIERQESNAEYSGPSTPDIAIRTFFT